MGGKEGGRLYARRMLDHVGFYGGDAFCSCRVPLFPTGLVASDYRNLTRGPAPCSKSVNSSYWGKLHG